MTASCLATEPKSIINKNDWSRGAKKHAGNFFISGAGYQG